MELISTLTVKDFPGINDGVYKFSQDTIIEGDYGTGKTSILKAITWLLTEKDLQGKVIPNIKDTTIVISRGSLELSRAKQSGLKGNLNRILDGNADTILSRIIPGYIFSGGITNKAAAQMMSGVDIDTYRGGSLLTISEITSAIKSKKNSQKMLLNISNLILQYNDNLKRYLSKSLLYTITDVHALVELNGLLEKLKLEIEASMIGSVSIKGALKIKELVTKENKEATNEGYKVITKYLLSKWLTFNKDTTIDDITMLLTYLKDKYCRGIARNSKNYIDTICGEMRKTYKEVNPTNIEIYYNNLMEEVTSLGKLIKDKQNLVDMAYRTVNDRLKQYGIILNLNNTLTVNVEYNGEKKTLTELPRHIRFLMEINICSRLQLNYINSHGGNQNYSGLILIDDYSLPDDNDSIDKILLEALSHQMIITKTVKGVDSINIKL